MSLGNLKMKKNLKKKGMGEDQENEIGLERFLLGSNLPIIRMEGDCELMNKEEEEDLSDLN